MYRYSLGLLVAAVLCSCGAPVSPASDAGEVDAGQVMVDAGAPDAGEVCRPEERRIDGGGCTMDLSWTAQTSIPAEAGRDHHATYVLSDDAGAVLFMTGGLRHEHAGTRVFGDTWKAPIDADGGIGAWTASTSTLPIVLAGPGVVTTERRVYLLGGASSAGFGTRVFSAALENGDLGTWREENAFIGSGRYHLTAFRWGNDVCTSGGFNSQAVFSDVQCATMGNDGVLAPFRLIGQIARGRSHHAVVIIDDAMVVIGGFDENAAAVTLVTRARRGTDGMLGTFEPLELLPQQRRTHAAAVVGRWLWVLHGEDGDGFDVGNAVTVMLRAPIRADGTIGSFESAGAQPARRHMHQAPVWGGRVYAVGGTDQASDPVLISHVASTVTP